MFNHPVYSPDFVSSDFHLLPNFKQQISCVKLINNDVVKAAFNLYFKVWMNATM